MDGKAWLGELLLDEWRIGDEEEGENRKHSDGKQNGKGLERSKYAKLVRLGVSAALPKRPERHAPLPAHSDTRRSGQSKHCRPAAIPVAVANQSTAGQQRYPSHWPIKAANQATAGQQRYPSQWPIKALPASSDTRPMGQSNEPVRLAHPASPSNEPIRLAHPASPSNEPIKLLVATAQRWSSHCIQCNRPWP
ncbi:hypothetical protein E2P81_ATG07701 [Venturia nashicola]|nr:hypothetical protein E2P81_ATG07701 [Venturia nashicola]